MYVNIKYHYHDEPDFKKDWNLRSISHFETDGQRHQLFFTGCSRVVFLRFPAVWGFDVQKWWWLFRCLWADVLFYIWMTSTKMGVVSWKMGFETIGNYIYEITVFLSTKTKICWRNVYVCVKWEKRIENKSASFSSLFQSCFHLMNLMRLRSWVALSGTGQWTFGIALERCFFPGGCPFQCWCTEGYGL